MLGNFLVKEGLCSQEINYLFSDKNPFFKKGSVKVFKNAGCQLIGFSHPDYILTEQKYIAFGYWQSEGDGKECFRDLEAWGKKQGGSLILGPINFSSLYDYRLPLDKNLNHFPGEPQQPSQYKEQLEKMGYGLEESYSSQYIKDPKNIFQWGQKRSERVIKRGRKLKMNRFCDFAFDARKLEVLAFLDRVFAPNLGYLKVNSFDFNYLYNKKVLEKVSESPSFFVEDENNNIVGLFLSFFGEDVFDLSSEADTLYFKTIAALSDNKKVQSEIFFFLIHNIFKEYERYQKKIPICFCLMRKGNVPDKVANMFSDETRSYGLFSKSI